MWDGRPVIHKKVELATAFFAGILLRRSLGALYPAALDFLSEKKLPAFISRISETLKERLFGKHQCAKIILGFL